MAVTVNLGKKGSFQIKHPGAFSALAKKHGMSTKAFAAHVLAHPSDFSPVVVRRARAAKGLMAMKH